MKITAILTALMTIAGTVPAQDFNVDAITQKALAYTVAVELELEVSFGIQTTEAKSRGIGTVVSPDGLVVFDGAEIDSDDPFSQLSGMQINAEPKSIEITFTDGEQVSRGIHRH